MRLHYYTINNSSRLLFNLFTISLGTEYRNGSSTCPLSYQVSTEIVLLCVHGVISDSFFCCGIYRVDVHLCKLGKP